MKRIKDITDIPFTEKKIEELLNFPKIGEVVRSSDKQYVGYGYSLIKQLKLESTLDYRDIIINDALIIALHSNDKNVNPYDDDIELMFEFPFLKIFDYTILTSMNRFLELNIPKIGRDFKNIILSICNYSDIKLQKKDYFPDLPVYYAFGEVNSYVDLKTNEYDIINEINLDLPVLEAKRWICI